MLGRALILLISFSLHTLAPIALLALYIYILSFLGICYIIVLLVYLLLLLLLAHPLPNTSTSLVAMVYTFARLPLK